jgi:tight adherence protein C
VSRRCLRRDARGDRRSAAPAACAGAALGWVGSRRRDTTRVETAIEALGRDLPDALELLAAAVDGGAPLERSLAAVASHLGEPLGGALRRATTATAASAGPTLSDALTAEGPALRSLAALVRSAEDLGTPVAGALRTLAVDERERRRRAVQRRAARAAPS